MTGPLEWQPVLLLAMLLDTWYRKLQTLKELGPDPNECITNPPCLSHIGEWGRQNHCERASTYPAEINGFAPAIPVPNRSTKVAAMHTHLSEHPCSITYRGIWRLLKNQGFMLPKLLAELEIWSHKATFKPLKLTKSMNEWQSKKPKQHLGHDSGWLHRIMRTSCHSLLVQTLLVILN